MKKILLILTLIFIFVLPVFGQTGTYTTNDYFYLPLYGAYGTTEFDEYNAYMEIADNQIEANKVAVALITEDVVEAYIFDADAETILGNWVNTTYPWADNEVSDTLTVTGYMEDADINTFSELQSWVSDKTLVNEEDVFTIDANWVNTASPWADNEVADNITIDLATLATTFTTTDNESEALACPIVFVDGATGAQGAETDDTDFTYNPSTGNISATQFEGITAANLVDKSATESISGTWTFSGSLIKTGSTSLVIRRVDDTPTNDGHLHFQRKRTTGGDISDDDEIGHINWYGWYTQYNLGATICAATDGTPGDGDMPTRLEFATSADASATPTLRLTLDSAGLATFTGAVSMTGELDITGALGCIDLNPAFQTTKNIIDLTPTATINATQLWRGFYLDGSALDPNGVDVEMTGAFIDFSGVSESNSPMIHGFKSNVPFGQDAFHIQEGQLHIDTVLPSTAVSEFTTLDIVIDSSALVSTSEYHAIDVATTGTPSGYVAALGAHSGIDVIHQHIGTFTTPNQTEFAGVKDDGGTVWNDGIDAYGVIFAAVSDAIYVGSAAEFAEIEVIMTTGGTKNIKPKFYYNTAADAWTEFFPADDTDGFQQSGEIRWELASITTPWTGDGDPGVGETTAGYWIKIVRTRVGTVGSPDPTTVKTGTVVEYKWDSLGDLTVNDIDANDIDAASLILDTALSPVEGGTGAANNVNETITLVGDDAIIFTTTGATGVTLPESGTLYGTLADSISSANLLSSISDETGTGLLVFATSPTFTTPVLGIASGSTIDLAYTNTAAGGDYGFQSHIQSTIAITGTLWGAYITASNNQAGACSGTIRGLEVKARTKYPAGTGGTVAVLEGISISADSKDQSVTTMRGMEVMLDGTTGGTVTEGVGIRIANNMQADKTTTMTALQIYSDSFAFEYGIDMSQGVGGITTDIKLSKGETIANNVDGIIDIEGELDMNAHTIGFTQQAFTAVDATTTIDWKLGNKFEFTFDDENQTFTFTQPTNPCNLLLVLIQDATGSRTVTWPGTVKWANGTAPVLSIAGAAIDICSFYWDGTNYFGVGNTGFAVP